MPRIQLTASAGSCRPFLVALAECMDQRDNQQSKENPGRLSPGELIQLVQSMIGGEYHVTGNPTLMDADEDELHGGRIDDHERAEELRQCFKDDDVAAVVSLRGGAWCTRILPRIDFSVLDRRTRPVTVVGFSEMTTLVNIVAGHPMGRGIYDMGPGFLPYGLKRHAETVLRLPAEALSHHPSSTGWARRELLGQVDHYFQDVLGMIEGRPSVRRIDARLISGELPKLSGIEFVGGNLCVLTTLLGSPYRRYVEPVELWLVLEDLNEKPERLDRFLSHLTLAGFWERCGGLLLGDFHRKGELLGPAVVELLRWHLPAASRMPILVSDQVGHIWPMSPLPLRVPMALHRTGERDYSLQWPSCTT